MPLYFAYGSNLDARRMRERVPGACSVGVSRLSGYVLRFDKAGRDGSGKANLHPDPGGEVWGVVYEIAESDWPRLDPHETGYDRIRAEPLDPAGCTLPAQTYRSARLTDDPRPFAWYLDHVLRGAREHALPETYVAALAATPVRPNAKE